MHDYLKILLFTIKARSTNQYISFSTDYLETLLEMHVKLLISRDTYSTHI